MNRTFSLVYFYAQCHGRNGLISRARLDLDGYFLHPHGKSFPIILLLMKEDLLFIFLYV